jgi:hypothetical protein
VTGLYAACAQHTVTRHAALETGGLTVVSAYLPLCQWQAILFDLDAPSPATALNAGMWVGDPRRASCHRHVAEPAPLPPWGAARGDTGPLPEGRWDPAPEAGWSGQACDGPAITRGGPGPPWGVRVRAGYPRAPLPSWARGDLGPLRAQERSGDHGPSCQARAVCHVTQKGRGRLRMVRR